MAVGSGLDDNSTDASNRPQKCGHLLPRERRPRRRRGSRSRKLGERSVAGKSEMTRGLGGDASEKTCIFRFLLRCAKGLLLLRHLVSHGDDQEV